MQLKIKYFFHKRYFLNWTSTLYNFWQADIEEALLWKALMKIEENTEHNDWDAQDLSHSQIESTQEMALLRLQEFDKEAEGKNKNEKQSDELPLA